MAPSSEHPPLRKMRASEFVRRIKGYSHEEDRHFVVWLGAGCSVSSGIPAAGTLVSKQWLPELHHFRTGGNQDFDSWVREEFPDYDPENAGTHYGIVMDRLFQLEEDRQRETERLCTKRDPGFGYGVLAALMSRNDGILSTALTTNFDDMIADAMYVYGERRPLVIEHETLASFVRPGRVLRPLVVKVHGDHRLNPMHTKSETAELKADIAEGIRGVLQDRGVIFVGYSGNDAGVLEALEALPREALPNGVWWVSRREPTGLIRGWLEGRDATWVEAGTFDELMLLFHQEFELAHPTVEKFDRMMRSYHATYESLTDDVERMADSAPDSAQLKAAARRADDAATSWWAVELEARRFLDDPERADQIYAEGVDRLESADLLGNYAFFLFEIRDDPQRARQMFERALRADPQHAPNLTSFANFLFRAQEYDRAQELYEQAAEIDPRSVETAIRYANLLSYTGRDPIRSREIAERCIDAAPFDPFVLGVSALIFIRTGDAADRKRAERLLQDSISINPALGATWGNLAGLQVETRQDDDARHSIAVAREHVLPGSKDAILELGFYQLVLDPSEHRAEILRELHDVLAGGGRSPRWNFDLVLERARADDHPDIEWLERLAAVIADDEDPSVLDDWPDWPSAPSSGQTV